MLVLRESGYRAVPWKNGGGVTREIMREPPDSPAFDWRLSLATIDSPGPFSAFDDYHRTLVLVRGAGVELIFAGHGRERLSAVGQMVSFEGEWQTSCELIAGPSTDLNLIVSRDRTCWTCRSFQVRSAEHVHTAEWAETLVCCISGALQLTNAAGLTEELAAADVARCGPSDGVILCRARGADVPHAFVAGVRRREQL